MLFNDDGMAETVFIDFEGMEGGGYPLEVGSMGSSRFVRDDSETMHNLASVGAARSETDIRYIVQGWSNENLAADTGRSGNVIVIDAFADVSGEKNPPILYTYVTMETTEVNTLAPAGTLPGPLSAPEEWAEYGEATGNEGAIGGEGAVSAQVFRGDEAGGEVTTIKMGQFNQSFEPPTF